MLLGHEHVKLLNHEFIETSHGQHQEEWQPTTTIKQTTSNKHNDRSCFHGLMMLLFVQSKYGKVWELLASNRHWNTKPWCPTKTMAKFFHMALRVQNLVKLHLLLPIRTIPIEKRFVLVLERLQPKSSRVCCWVKLCCQCLVGILNLTLCYSFLNTHLKQY